MEQKRDATRVDEPAGEPPDKDLAFDPTMTDTDEANVPPDSDCRSNLGSRRTTRAEVRTPR